MKNQLHLIEKKHFICDFSKVNYTEPGKSPMLKSKIRWSCLIYAFTFFSLLAVLQSCNSPYVSKKRGYFKINLPERNYRTFDNPEFPYSFEYPVYANIVKDSTYFDNNPEDKYWVNIDFPQFSSSK